MIKTYDHIIVEKDKNKKWMDKKYFSTHNNSNKPFTIILPPPNVTGKLHLGHAWDAFIQDTMIRYKKLKGFDVLWVPGMDHAGIATQAKVEQKIFQEENKTRFDLGREKFLNKIWNWKDDYAQHIREQWGKLGLALDYNQERFTMDEGLSEAVQKVFIDMYNQNLIYRGKRAINWDPKLKTVLSNIEVISRDTKSNMYYIKYKLDNNFIEVATTRPETMFSDVAIAVNPNDEKMKKYIGKTAVSPLTNEILPIIGDEHIKIGKGTSAMKVSAHAIADIDIIIKNDLELKECIDVDGNMNENANDLKGINRFEARDKVVKLLKERKTILKIEEITNAVGYSERSGEVVEIIVSPQWFVKMKPLSEKLLKDLNSKDGVKFFPHRFQNTLETWMKDVHDWTISRQLWWGHRIPAWYKNEEIKVQLESPGDDWVQDEDVLDTWFSSGIAPFSFLNWPQDEKMINKYYPTSLLVTGYDIIFFWVARMYFQSLHFMNEKPFEHVLIHGLIRAEDGKKMSKSLGNGIDPMDTIEKYGSDSLRWFLLTNSTPGQDIRYSTEKLESSWKLCNKIWNISRYILNVMPSEKTDVSDADKWIINKFNVLESFIEDKIDVYEFTIIGKELTKFIMEDFSSWYIEFTKAKPNKDVSVKILKSLLVLIHPFLPFLTDHIYSMIDGTELLEQHMKPLKKYGDANYIDLVIDIVNGIREFRETTNLSKSKEIYYYFKKKLPHEATKIIKILANAQLKETYDSTIVSGKTSFYVMLNDEIKMMEEKRLSKQIVFLEKEIERARNILKNPNFIEKAPQEKIDVEKKKLKMFLKQLEEIKNKF